MSIEVFKNIVWEPELWKEYNTGNKYEQLHDNALRRFGKLNRLCGDLSVIMQTPLERFDDDKKTGTKYNR